MPHLASFRLQVLLLAVVCVASAVPMWAQKDAGSIVGTVKDQTGAIVTSAKVTVSDVERGIHLETTTNESGEYVAGPLRVGRYTVTVEHPGFKRSITPPVDLGCAAAHRFRCGAAGGPDIRIHRSHRRNSSARN